MSWIERVAFNSIKRYGDSSQIRVDWSWFEVGSNWFRLIRVGLSALNYEFDAIKGELEVIRMDDLISANWPIKAGERV